MRPDVEGGTLLRGSCREATGRSARRPLCIHPDSFSTASHPTIHLVSFRSLSRRRQGAVSRGLQDCPPSGGGLPLEGTRLLDVLCFTGDRARGRDPCLCPHAPPMHAPLRARIPLYIFMNESINTSKKLGEQLSYLLASPRMDKTHPLTQAHAMHACHAFTGCWRPMLRRRRRRRCGARPRPPGSCPGAPWHPPG